MLFHLLLYTSLLVFVAGFVHKVFRWFSRQIPGSTLSYGTAQRMYQAVRGFLGVVFSGRILTLLRALVLDVLLQLRILKEDRLRWVMHMLIYTGFTLLLLMHALEAWTSQVLFSDYASTANPFFFLRNLFGLMVVVGVGISIYRRFIAKVPRLRTSAMDRYSLIIVAVILLSGFFLEGAKILSYNDYQRMVVEYGDTEDPEELKALEVYWVAAMGMASPHLKGPFENDILTQGRELHEMSCLACHAPSRCAFIGYGASVAMRPMARFLDDIRTTEILWLLHIVACFFGLAYLPFSNMSHIIVSPLSILSNAVMSKERSHPANIQTRQVMELDACARCGTCSLRCSSAPAFDVLENRSILPSRKLQVLRRMVAGKTLSLEERRTLREGLYICTNCDRCTDVCPAGINLRELWVRAREGLLELEGGGEPLMLSPYSFVRGLNRSDLSDEGYNRPLEAARQCVTGAWNRASDPGAPISLNGNGDAASVLPHDPGTFYACFTCQNCTTVCPVVASYDSPQETLGLLPHQIMCSLGLGLLDMACGSQMLWDCVTCYQCQEHCPQMVEVTDILFRLKNMAIRGPQAPTDSPSVSEAGQMAHA